MIIKWIVCQVPEEKKTAFTEAQMIWSSLSDAEGFYGQWGGWNIYQPTKACIFSIWQSLSAYESFMSSIHDTLFLTSDQSQTYQSISVDLSKLVLSIPGEKEFFYQALSHSYLRMADCMVKPKRINSFLQAQKTIWNPAMGQTKGMIAGVIGETIKIPNRYLVLSLWKDKQSHEAYTKRVIDLRQQAKTDQDIESVSGCLVQLEEKWLVLPKR
ncbi:YdbC family protein [Thermoflavimicrobium daqui]|jgi:heme-degrading monooxygenase HmoA|uniref:DUF4937 domain-containing protein n=1 Tax=Thermoflavimicrobium daqui TaxID=2137476 RepID=A0A364K3Y8_9BACL|nr:YdbC family protein [Thermoflavimicrobium daqui]RAL24066.1 DUF4937 domain-containing protein [Thermoflavimicrobium daqui]